INECSAIAVNWNASSLCATAQENNFLTQRLRQRFRQSHAPASASQRQPLQVPALYSAWPTSAPITAVTAMAIAPHTSTRQVARHGAAPPALAPTAPSSARHSSVTTVTAAMRQDAGASTAASSGQMAPAAKVAAEVRAA